MGSPDTASSVEAVMGAEARCHLEGRPPRHRPSNSGATVTTNSRLGSFVGNGSDPDFPLAAARR